LAGVAVGVDAGTGDPSVDEEANGLSRQTLSGYASMAINRAEYWPSSTLAVCS